VKTAEERHIIVLRCEDVPLRGLLADNVYQDLVGIEDPEERKRRIIAAAERHSQAAPPPPRPFIGVPPRIASFTGRSGELDRLDVILMRDKPAAVTQASVGRAAVQGMGGVGKTSLAVEYAHRYRSLYAGVCWCPAETRTGLLSALAGLAVTLGAATVEEADVEKAAKAALRRLAEQRATWLLVYDNVPAPDAVADLLPSAGARMLITSRFSDWSELADDVALDVLPLEEAVALLRSRTGRGYAGAQTLAEVLGCLPLALDHAAAYCKRTQMRFADYAEKASSLISTAPRGAVYPRSVAATFNLGIAEAVRQCSAAEALMAYLAQCAPERIPMTLVEGAIDEDAMRTLIRHGLRRARPGACPCGGRGQHFSRAGETVARSTAASVANAVHQVQRFKGSVPQRSSLVLTCNRHTLSPPPPRHPHQVQTDVTPAQQVSRI
jgi:NB-ARC domain